MNAIQQMANVSKFVLTPLGPTSVLVMVAMSSLAMDCSVQVCTASIRTKSILVLRTCYRVNLVQTLEITLNPESFHSVSDYIRALILFQGFLHC